MPKTFVDGHAVVVGVGADLAVTIDDATAVADLLRDPGRCAYPSDQVQLFTGEQATAANILAALKKLAKSTSPESTALVYFSGHGLETPAYYLIPHGYDLADLPGTAIPGEVFSERLRAIEAKKLLVLLDCCHAGGQAEAKGLPGVKSPLPPSVTAELKRGSGRVVLASSRKDEQSWTGKPYSVFTAALLEGLAGYGAFERDGYARVLDLAMYVGRMAPERTNDKQHPIIKVSNLEDNFALAYYAAGEKEPKSLDWASTVPAAFTGIEGAQAASWRRMLANRRRALALMDERMSEYIEYQEIPLQLIDNKRRTEEQIADLERKLGLRT
jgi:hypothetical protein